MRFELTGHAGIRWGKISNRVFYVWFDSRSYDMEDISGIISNKYPRSMVDVVGNEALVQLEGGE